MLETGPGTLDEVDDSKKPQVFISYSSADGGEVAERLRRDLEAGGATVFQYEGTARPGDPTWSQVVRGIRDSEWFVVLLTEESLRSKAVEYEIEQALSSWMNSEDNRPTLLPVVIGGVEIPDLLATVNAIKYTSYDDCIAKLRTVLRLELASPDTELPSPDSLACSLVAAPRRATVGETVYWTADVENRSSSRLRSVVLRLGGSVVAGPFDLKPGKTKTAEVPVVYDAPGNKKRTLVVTATTAQGEQISARTERGVKVQQRPSLESARRPRSTTTKTDLQARLQTPRLREILNQAPQQRTQDAGTAATSDTFESAWGEAFGMMAVAAVTSLGVAIGGFFALRWLLNWYGSADLPDWLQVVPSTLEGWPGWLVWASAIALILVAISIGFFRAEAVFIVDVLDSFWASLSAGVLAVGLGGLWSYLWVEMISSSTATWVTIGAVVATLVGVTLSIIDNEI